MSALPAVRSPLLLLVVAGLVAAAPAGVPVRALACGDPDLLAMDLNDDPLPPPALVAAIAADLAVVRAQQPVLAGIHCREPWSWGLLIVKLTPEAFAAFMAGGYSGLDDLNELYGATGMSVRSTTNRYVDVTFDACYDYARLAAIYAEPVDVEWATAASVIGDGDDIVAESSATYVFSRGWDDCLSGCIHRHYWRVRVVAGVAVVLEEWGDPYSGSPVPGPAPAVRIALRQNEPNPFNPRTTIPFLLAAAGPARLEVFDAAGRRVRGLVAGDLPAGAHEAIWDGRDDAGRMLGSGSYLARLESGGAVTGIRMTLLR